MKVAATVRRVALGVLIALLFLAIFGLSNPAMDAALAHADRNPDSGAGLLWNVAGVCRSTWRPLRAAAAYRRIYERHPGDAERPLALLRLAQCLEDAGRNAEALDLYEKFLLEYPLRPERPEAEFGRNRLRP
jgi:tetratricopeptide (TPR) repeat protein